MSEDAISILDFELCIPTNYGFLDNKIQLRKCANGWSVIRVLTKVSDLEKQILLNPSNWLDHTNRKEFVENLNGKLAAKGFKPLGFNYQAENVYESAAYPVAFVRSTSGNKKNCWVSVYTDAVVETLNTGSAWDKDTIDIFYKTFHDQSFSKLFEAKQAVSEFIVYYDLLEE